MGLGDAGAPGYSIIIPDETIARDADYLEGLRAGKTQAGARLRVRLLGCDVQALTELSLPGKLMDTKPPQIFAERLRGTRRCGLGNGRRWRCCVGAIERDLSVPDREYSRRATVVVVRRLRGVVIAIYMVIMVLRLLLGRFW